MFILSNISNSKNEQHFLLRNVNDCQTQTRTANMFCLAIVAVTMDVSFDNVTPTPSKCREASVRCLYRTGKVSKLTNKSQRMDHRIR